MNKILISFDVEEFDIPEEYGVKVHEKQQLEITRVGLSKILELLDKWKITATFYTTAFFAERNSNLIKNISETHEIASHGFYHSSMKNEDILNSKITIERITGKPVQGFRMPRLLPIDETLLARSGYIYNSSLNPTFIPGRYNNFDKPRTPFIASGIMQLPVSVALPLRIPLFWLTFKNFPITFYNWLALRTLNQYRYLNLYFHPWEFANISSYNLPYFIKRIDSVKLRDRFEMLISCLKEEGEFISSIEYCREFLAGINRAETTPA